MRQDPYYPPQDPRWAAFERFLKEKRGWKGHWNFCENLASWWPFWEAFCAGAAAKEVSPATQEGAQP